MPETPPPETQRPGETVPDAQRAGTGRPALRRAEPLDPPMVPFAVVGIVLWALAGLTLLLFRGWLSDHHHMRWLWTCLAGVVSGFVGLAMMIKRDAGRRRRRNPPEH